MIEDFLQRDHRKILDQVKQLRNELQRCFTNLDGANPFVTQLEQTAIALDRLFLLVVMGEFNAGKSSFINALLGEKFLEEGPTETTKQITVVHFGKENKIDQRSHHAKQIIERVFPSEFLRDISLVDTPGTNTPYIEQERLTKDFIPNSDLILFVMKVDSAGTKSEIDFLKDICRKNKKVIIVVNKIEPPHFSEVWPTVKASLQIKFAQELPGYQLEIFPVSAHMAQDFHKAAGVEAIRLWEKSGFAALFRHLQLTLDEVEQVRLKLSNPVEIMRTQITESLPLVARHTDALNRVEETIDVLHERLDAYRKDMQDDFTSRLSDIKAIILEMQNEGNRFFDDAIRLGRLLDLMDSEKMKEEFTQKVIGKSPERIDRVVKKLTNWIEDEERRLQKDIAQYLDRLKGIMNSRSKWMQAQSSLFDSQPHNQLQLAQIVHDAIESYNPQTEARALSRKLQRAARAAATASTGSLGLGVATITIVGTTTIGIGGLIAGTLLGGFTLYIVPHHRAQAKDYFNRQMTELDGRLSIAINTQFNDILDDTMNNAKKILRPYEDYLSIEKKKIEEIRQHLYYLGIEINTVRIAIQNMH
jgi:small GTP-binding protein